MNQISHNCNGPGDGKCSKSEQSRSESLDDMLGVFQLFSNVFNSLSDEKYESKPNNLYDEESIVDDLEHIAQKLREDGRLTHEGANKIAMMEENMKAKGSAPLIRIDEWNPSKKQWHNRCAFRFDDEENSMMNGSYQNQTSRTSDALKCSIHGMSLDFDKSTNHLHFDNSKDLFLERTLESSLSSCVELERSISQNFLLTVGQDGADAKLQNKHLLVSINLDDEVESDDNVEVDSKKPDGIDYEDNNISVQKLHSMKLPSKIVTKKNRIVNIREVKFCEVIPESAI